MTLDKRDQRRPTGCAGSDVKRKTDQRVIDARWHIHRHTDHEPLLNGEHIGNEVFRRVLFGNIPFRDHPGSVADARRAHSRAALVRCQGTFSEVGNQHQPLGRGVKQTKHQCRQRQHGGHTLPIPIACHFDRTVINAYLSAT